MPVRAVNRLKPLMEKALGKGTNEPGLHVTLTVQDPRGKYVPGRDTRGSTPPAVPEVPYGGAADRGRRRPAAHGDRRSTGSSTRPAATLGTGSSLAEIH